MRDTHEFKIFGVTGYTVMSNYHFQDKNLSIKAKGLLGLMLSLPKDWDYSINGLVTLSKDGRDSVRATLKELQEAEYVSIERYKDEKGQFKYKYTVYYLPYPIWLKNEELSRYGFSTSVNPSTENPIQQNNNNKIDKVDKEQRPYLKVDEIEHNILTNNLIDKNYITKNDASSFLFDELFEKLLEENDYHLLMKISNYIISKVKGNNYKDEENNEIRNKYGYFKESIMSNIKRLNNEYEPSTLGDDLLDYDWLSDSNYEI